jgi:hypothetical protein
MDIAAVTAMRPPSSLARALWSAERLADGFLAGTLKFEG